jgi:hypothetical protein
MSEGWFRLHRDVFTHPVLSEDENGNRLPFSKLEAWLWMIGEAAWADRRANIGGQIVTLRRGQFSHSIRFMAKAWQWGVATVDRFLKRLKNEQMIGTASGTASGTAVTVITICNYDKYQSDAADSGTPSGTPSGTAAEQQRNRLEEREEGKKEEKKDLRQNGHAHDAAKPAKSRAPSALSEFEPVWKTYPRKVGRGAAEKAWTKALATVHDPGEITGPLAAFVAASRRVEPKFIPHLATWLNQQRWRDETGGSAASVDPDEAAYYAKLDSWGIPH